MPDGANRRNPGTVPELLQIGAGLMAIARGLRLGRLTG
jgi:hypothetical protein